MIKLRIMFVWGLLFSAVVLARADDGPPRAGLTAWLDGADGSTLERGPDGRLAKWRDKSGKGHDALNEAEKSNPATITAEDSGTVHARTNRLGQSPNQAPELSLLRFNGKSDCLTIAGPIRAGRGPVTVFVVSRRTAEQASQIAAAMAKRTPKKATEPPRPWQRLVGSSDGTATPDNKTPNFMMCGPRDGEGIAYPLTIDDQELDDVALGTLRIGAGGSGKSGFLAGDIGEVLVYERRFLAEGDIRVVREYLQKKWGARMAYEERGWTRIGELENPPKRINNDWPLSDPQNKGGWKKDATFSDEFEGTRLDPAKWRDQFERWKGRPPGRFNPANVTVSDGKLHLTMRKEPIPKALEAPGYKDYTSAAVQGLTKTGYGYYEVMARPMNSGGSSSFWFSGSEGRDRTEIDVFEIGGKAPGFERKYNMNLHVFETPQEKRHWNVGGVWIAPWRLADDYHVYGLEWGKDEITYYVDGVAVRRVKNTNWHFPLFLDFDSETMPDWFGMPKDEDLPSTYSIEYVRAWKK